MLDLQKLGVKITSKALSAIVSKMVLYQSAVILVFILEKYLLINFFTSIFGVELFLTKIVATTLCGIELMSINESYKIVRPDEKIEAKAIRGSGWGYSAFINLSDQDLKIFSTKEIDKFRLYIYDNMKPDDTDKFPFYVESIIKLK